MIDMIISVKALQEQLPHRIRSERVRFHENNGVITLTPIEEPEIDFWNGLDELRAIFSDGRMSTEKYVAQKQIDKELEG